MYNQSRAGLYITKSTRSRLNLFKAQYALKHGRFVNQSEAIDALLDLAGIARPAASQVGASQVGAPQAAALPDTLPLMDLRSEQPAA